MSKLFYARSLQNSFSGDINFAKQCEEKRSPGLFRLQVQRILERNGFEEQQAALRFRQGNAIKLRIFLTATTTDYPLRINYRRGNPLWLPPILYGCPTRYGSVSPGAILLKIER